MTGQKMTGSEPTRRRRILYLLRQYPQISQTYVKCELDHVVPDNDVLILTRKRAYSPYKNHYPHINIDTLEEAIEHGRAFKPDVIHAHYVTQLDFVHQVSKALGVPYTVRSHSFDVMAMRWWSPRKVLQRFVGPLKDDTQRQHKLKENLKLTREDNCLGVVGFHFSRKILARAGAPEKKLVDCWPVVNVARFEDRSENGTGIMNTGTVLQKKKMEDFLELSKLMPDMPFTLYGMNYDIEKLRAKNEEMGAKVDFHSLVEPEDMLPEYKKHSWLVYTGDIENPRVGWPMSVAEAQAAGVGVAMPRLRPDIIDYVGKGAGVIYDHISELPSIVSQPPPQEMREAGFEAAKKSDIRNHLHLLTDLWPAPSVEASQAA
jgi:hypothetical protein